MNRIGFDEICLLVAHVISQRGTCARRQVGCVLTDVKNRIIATGYNGRPRGWPHCLDDGSVDAYACAGVSAPSGVDLDGCEAIHAEQNALLQCDNVDLVHTCYVTVSPCVACVKLLLNTGCRRIVFAQAYAPQHVRAAEILAARGAVDWVCLG